MRKSNKNNTASTLAVLKGGQEQGQPLKPVCPYCGRELDQVNWTTSNVGEPNPLTVIFCPYSDCRKVITAHF